MLLEGVRLDIARCLDSLLAIRHYEIIKKYSIFLYYIRYKDLVNKEQVYYLSNTPKF